MARTRYIKPGFFTNENLTEFGPWHRLLFAGLWIIADRAGRLEDRPKRIKAEVFPHDTIAVADIDAMLTDLAKGSEPFIARYEVAGTRYIQIVKWASNQKPHNNETPSTIPSLERNTKKTEQFVEFAPKPEVSTTMVVPSSHFNGELELKQERGMGNGQPPQNAPAPPRFTTPAEKAHRGHAFPDTCAIGKCLMPTQADAFEKQLIANNGGIFPDGANIRQFAAEVVAEWTAKGVPADDTFRAWQAVFERRMGVRRGGLAAKPQPSYANIGAWRDECVRIHGVTEEGGPACGNQSFHLAKLASEKVPA